MLFRSPDQNLALVGEVNARQHVHERRFAASVFAQQGQNFAPPHLKTDFVVGDDLAKALGQISDLYRVFLFNGAFPASPLTPIEIMAERRCGSAMKQVQNVLFDDGNARNNVAEGRRALLFAFVEIFTLGNILNIFWIFPLC